MEFLINFKTITEAHLVLSLSQTWVQKHRVRFGSQTQPQPQKILLYKPKKKKNGNNETWKHGNWIRDCISETVFLRLHFQDCSPEITGIGTAFMGLRFRDHGNWDFILNIMEAGSHFFNYRNRIKILISWNRDCISDITGVGTAFPKSRDRVCTSEITETAL